MKLNSKYFDSIRTTSKKAKKSKPTQTKQRCSWQDCNEPGDFPAPRGRDSEGEYFYFCKVHVQSYNKSYNYFDGMPNEDVVDFQTEAKTGHRPTWKMNDKNAGRATGRYNKTNGFGGHRSAEAAINSETIDPFDLFEEDTSHPGANPAPVKRSGRSLERKHLATLGLELGANKLEIKAKYKALVKKHHPDVNKGDKDSEERLREVLNAYNFLKQAGIV